MGSRHSYAFRLSKYPAFDGCHFAGQKLKSVMREPSITTRHPSNIYQFVLSAGNFYKTVWIRIRPDKALGLIWIPTG